MREIHVGFKDERGCLAFLDLPGQFAVHHEVQRLAAVGALALDLDHQRFVT